MGRAWVSSCFVVVAALIVSCEGDSSPTAPAPVRGSLAGAWRGELSGSVGGAAFTCSLQMNLSDEGEGVFFGDWRGECPGGTVTGAVAAVSFGGANLLNALVAPTAPDGHPFGTCGWGERCRSRATSCGEIGCRRTTARTPPWPAGRCGCGSPADGAEPMSRWALAAGATETWRRFADDWRATPRAARRRWGAVLLAGWAGCAVLALGLAVGGRHLAAEGMAERDREQLLALVAESPMSFQAAIWFEGWGSSAMLIPLVLVAVVVAARAGRSLVALTIAAAYLLHDPLVFLMNWVWPRARPDLVAGGIASPPLHSFPSGHVVQVLAVYGLLAYLWARRSASGLERLLAAAVLAFLTAVVGYARLRLGTHWPSDLWASVPLGTAWLLACVLALRAGERGAAAGSAPGRPAVPP